MGQDSGHASILNIINDPIYPVGSRKSVPTRPLVKASPRYLLGYFSCFSKGVTYGTIDKRTENFRGSFRIRGEDYYIQDADDFGIQGYDSILYRGSDVIRSNARIEPEYVPDSHDFEVRSLHSRNVRSKIENLCNPLQPSRQKDLLVGIKVFNFMSNCLAFSQPLEQ